MVYKKLKFKKTAEKLPIWLFYFNILIFLHNVKSIFDNFKKNARWTYNFNILMSSVIKFLIWKYKFRLKNATLEYYFKKPYNFEILRFVIKFSSFD